MSVPLLSINYDTLTLEVEQHRADVVIASGGACVMTGAVGISAGMIQMIQVVIGYPPLLPLLG